MLLTIWILFSSSLNLAGENTTVALLEPQGEFEFAAMWCPVLVVMPPPPVTDKCSLLDGAAVVVGDDTSAATCWVIITTGVLVTITKSPSSSSG